MRRGSRDVPPGSSLPFAFACALATWVSTLGSDSRRPPSLSGHLSLVSPWMLLGGGEPRRLNRSQLRGVGWPSAARTSILRGQPGCSSRAITLAGDGLETEGTRRTGKELQPGVPGRGARGCVCSARTQLARGQTGEGEGGGSWESSRGQGGTP